MHTMFWYCRVDLVGYFLLILPGFFSTDTQAHFLEILALVQCNLSFKSLWNAWCDFPSLCLTYSAWCFQAEEWDQRFHTVRRDLNKWSSSKSIFPHLSPARGFICLVICNMVSRLKGPRMKENLKSGAGWGYFRCEWGLWRGNGATRTT